MRPFTMCLRIEEERTKEGEETYGQNGQDNKGIYRVVRILARQ